MSALFFQNPVYNWSPEIQGVIFSSIFYGVLFTQVPVGYLSRIYSIKKMVGSALFLSSLLCLFIPLAAEIGVTFVITCRVVQGAAQVLRNEKTEQGLNSQEVSEIKCPNPFHFRGQCPQLSMQYGSSGLHLWNEADLPL